MIGSTQLLWTRYRSRGWEDTNDQDMNFASKQLTIYYRRKTGSKELYNNIVDDIIKQSVYCYRWESTSKIEMLFERYVVVVDQSPIRGQLFVIPWIAARQTSLSLTISQSLSKLKSINICIYVYTYMYLYWATELIFTYIKRL